MGRSPIVREMKQKFLPYLAFILFFNVSSLTYPPLAGAAVQNLTVYTDGEAPSKLAMTALVTAFHKANLNSHISLTVGPVGVAGVENIKAKLNAGTMADVFTNSVGSLFQALHPSRNLVDLTGEQWHSSVVTSFFKSVSVGPVIYGAPFGSAMGGGILYNKAIYRKLSLKIPLSWREFMANNAQIRAAGITPVIQTYADSWTAQLLILADGFNLLTSSPNFATLLTANRVQIASTPAAVLGFKHLEEIHRKGYQNSDYKSATLSKGIEYLAKGKGAHYPMLSFVDTELNERFPVLAKNVGIFAQPGLSKNSNGLTVWMPNGLFIPKSSKHIELAKRFIAFSVSTKGLEVMRKAVRPSGPYMIIGANLDGSESTITKEMLKYFESNGQTGPALEFLTIVKGPNLSEIAVRVGSGKISAILGAITYDADIRAESRRLGLPGWGKLG